MPKRHLNLPKSVTMNNLNANVRDSKGLKLLHISDT